MTDKVNMRITEVTVGSNDNPYDTRAITVSWRGDEDYCVKQGIRVWCERRKRWEAEPIPSGRTDAFIARTRYPFVQARDIAVRLMGKQLNEAAP